MKWYEQLRAAKVNGEQGKAWIANEQLRAAHVNGDGGKVLKRYE